MNESGYTLSELVATCAIMGLLFFVSIPSVASFGRRESLVREADRLRQELLSVIIQGQLRHELSTVEFQDHSVRILEAKRERMVILSHDVEISTSSSPLMKVYPTGVVSPLTVTVKERVGSGSCKLTISLRGRILNSCDRASSHE